MIKLNPEDQRIYNLIMEKGTMQDMFEFAYAVSQIDSAKEQLKNFNKYVD